MSGELIRLVAFSGGVELEVKVELLVKHLFGSPGSLPCC